MAKLPDLGRQAESFGHKLANRVFKGLLWMSVMNGAFGLFWAGLLAVSAFWFVNPPDELERLPYWRGLSLALLLLLAIATITLLILTRKYRKVRQSLSKEEKTAPAFLNLAYDNAICDKTLFDELFLPLHSHVRNGATAATLSARIETAHKAIYANLREIVNKTAEIFEDYTGSKCAACIRVPRDDNGRALNLIFIRDSTSAAERINVDRRKYEIEENTAPYFIVLKKGPVYVCDDLQRAQAAGEYENPAEGWERRYNATLVSGIFEPGKEDASNDLLGFLCVDNKTGGFENEACIRHITELSWRLSVMLYRYKSLERIIEENIAVK
jgi:hypothetical protein